jgi:hypothetical protein
MFLFLIPFLLNTVSGLYRLQCLPQPEYNFEYNVKSCSQLCSCVKWQPPTPYHFPPTPIHHSLPPTPNWHHYPPIDVRIPLPYLEATPVPQPPTPYHFSPTSHHYPPIDVRVPLPYLDAVSVPQPPSQAYSTDNTQQDSGQP